MGNDKPNSDEIKIKLGGGLLDAIEKQDQLRIVLSEDDQVVLEGIARDMKTEQTISSVVELALELIIASRGKEIHIVDQGRIIKKYYFWKPGVKG